MTLLIIGATGYIGKYIYESAKEKFKVIGTQYQSNHPKFIKFNILKDDISIINKQISDTEKYALLCAGDTNIEYCFQHKNEAYQKNVIATIQLINQLNTFGYHIIFLSTDNVFNGKKGNYTEEDTPTPINEYGKMKTEVEHYLIQHISDSCIMRIGKIIGNFAFKKDLLLEWYNMARNEKSISCIKGNIFTLTHISDIVKSFFLIIENNMHGLYHIVSNESDSRENLCKRFLNYIDLEPHIISKNILEFHFSDNRPLNISMKNTRFVKETGYQFMNLDDICQNFITEYLHITERKNNIINLGGKNVIK